jgi:hypothetical protein
MKALRAWQFHKEASWIGSPHAFSVRMGSDSEDWKRLCKMVADEADPGKLTGLVEQLIGALDARKEHLEEPDRRRTSVLSTTAEKISDGD